jgi:epoxyqueuosine reductase
MRSDIGAQIIHKAKEMGAAAAGIASVESLRRSPSHMILGLKTGLEIPGFGGIRWPAQASSALVIAVSHPEHRPELDWWDVKSAPGNRVLIRIIRELSVWIGGAFDIRTHPLLYAVENGGAFLKDAAVLAGLGCIGKNNLLVTPGFGPRVRLRAMLLESQLAPTGPIPFDPCDGCGEFCREACPQRAFETISLSSAEAGMDTVPGRDGKFSRARCEIQMEKDIDDSQADRDEMAQFEADLEEVNRTPIRIKYCRRCEFACPVGSYG